VTAVNGGDSISETCEIEVVAKGKGVTKVKLNKKSAELPRGKALTLSATIKPAGAKDRKILWVSSDPAIATVNSKGKVKAVGRGEVVITAYGSSGKKAECKITVTGPLVKKITLSAPRSMKVGETVQIVAAITPVDAENQNLKWKVSDKKIARISKTGELTALKKGRVTITATARDGSKVKATIVIKIKK